MWPIFCYICKYSRIFAVAQFILGLLYAVTMSDVETGVNPTDSFHHIILDGFDAISFFMILVVFILYVFSQTTIYNNNILKNMKSGSVSELNQQSEKGIMITGILMGILVALLDALHRKKLI